MPPSQEERVREQFLVRARHLAGLRSAASVSLDDPFFRKIPADVKNRHQERVANLKRKYAEQDSQQAAEAAIIASAFEYVIAERITKFGWLGKDMRAQLTSDFDDTHNGVDLYVERKGKPIGISFDVAYTKNRDRLAKKMGKLKESIDNGRLTQLDYYVPLDEAKRQEMDASDGYAVALPKVIIGVTETQMETAINRFYDNPGEKPDVPSGLIFLYQTRLQLAHFISYIEQERHRKPHATKPLLAYRNALAEIEEVWREKLREHRLDEVKVVQYARNEVFTRNLQELLNEQLPLGP